MNVTLIDSMGTDLSVANAARVSFAKKNEELDAEKKKELKKMVEDGYDDPEKLSREIARMFGLEHG